MKEMIVSSAVFGVLLSLGAFRLGQYIKEKCKSAVFNPLLISIILVMLALYLLDIEYEVYKSSAVYLSYLLTPATVCLAIPLYQQLDLLKQNGKAILLGILSGVCSSAVSVLGLSVLFGLTHQQYVTLLPKSITTAIGMGVSEELGGIVQITVAIILITGVIGNIVAEQVLKLFKITHPIAKGLAIGTSSHAIGTARAIEIGEVEGAMSGLAIAVSGVFTVVAASIFAMFY